MKATNPSESKFEGSAETANRDETITASALPEIPVEDGWALKYITKDRLLPLMEALGGNSSSLVTVDEVNEFTSRRPNEWRWVSGATVSLHR